MFHRAVRYAKRNHPRKSATWMQDRYFGGLNPKRDANWVFGDKRTGMYLLKFGWFPIERHVLVQGNASPDDAKLRDYWARRNIAQAKNLKPSRCRIAMRQHGRCLRCGESLFNGEELHVHHKVWKRLGGQDTTSNYELVHLYCHQQIHATAGGPALRSHDEAACCF